MYYASLEKQHDVTSKLTTIHAGRIDTIQLNMFQGTEYYYII